MKHVLVTGGFGFIGCHLVKRLIKDHIVWIVDDFSNACITDNSWFATFIRNIIPQMLDVYDYQSDQVQPKIITIQSDFAHKAVLEKVSSGFFSSIYHLAANPRVEWSIENPISATNENFFKTVQLARAAALGHTRFIFSSTSAVYGNVKSLPTYEFTPKSPTSPYGLSKYCVEQYLRLFEKLYDLDWVALRYFNVYGPMQSGFSPYATAVSAWCTKASQGAPLRSDGDGEQTRDMVYVEDVVDANILVAKCKSFLVRTLNVGTGRSVSNNYILEKFAKRGYTDVKKAPKRIGDVKHTLAQIAELSELGWTPKYDFDDGIELVLDYWGL